MHRITDITRGVAALAATLALLLGLPAVLAATVGWPLPTATPSIDLIRTHLTDGDLPDLFVIKLLAVIVWILWAQLAVGLLVEIRASIAGRASRRAPLLPGIQLLAAKLVTWATLVLTAFAPARPVIAAPLTPIEVTTSLVDNQAAPVLVGAHRGVSSNAELATATDETAVAPFTYRTSRDDSWWSIAEDLLGDGLRWSDVRDANLGRRMADGTTIADTTDTVRAGWQLKLPADATPPMRTLLPPSTIRSRSSPAITSGPSPTSSSPRLGVAGRQTTRSRPTGPNSSPPTPTGCSRPVTPTSSTPSRSSSSPLLRRTPISMST